ncbi:MAG TPA: OmpH family outer membrane protein [Gammaproteobacteria bacterium]|nr:OmpH family outer membrane protein [Gammaproteobacteria bacterium]
MQYKIVTGMVAAAALLLSGAAMAATTPKIGVINVDYVIAHSKRGKAADQALKALAEKKQAELKKEQAKLAATNADLKQEKQKDTADFKNKVTAFQQSYGAFQQHVKESQSEFQKRQADLMNPIFKDLKKVLEDYGKAHGYTLILNRTSNAVAYAVSSTDLNDEVIKALDKFEGE